MQVTRQCVSRLDATAFKRQDETGFLDVRVFPTKAAGFPYLDKATGKTIRELSPPEEVFKPESLKALVNKPLVTKLRRALVSENLIEQSPPLNALQGGQRHFHDLRKALERPRRDIDHISSLQHNIGRLGFDNLI
jgi:hypothetical protein